MLEGAALQVLLESCALGRRVGRAIARPCWSSPGELIEPLCLPFEALSESMCLLESLSSSNQRGAALERSASRWKDQIGYVLLGCLAFVVAFAFDLAALNGIRCLKQAIGLALLLNPSLA